MHTSLYQKDVKDYYLLVGLSLRSLLQYVNFKGLGSAFCFVDVFYAALKVWPCVLTSGDGWAHCFIGTIRCCCHQLDVHFNVVWCVCLDLALSATGSMEVIFLVYKNDLWLDFVGSPCR